MPEMHLRQPGFTYSQHGFTYSVCEPFTKKQRRRQKFKEAGDLQYIYIKTN